MPPQLLAAIFALPGHSALDAGPTQGLSALLYLVGLKSASTFWGRFLSGPRGYRIGSIVTTISPSTSESCTLAFVPRRERYTSAVDHKMVLQALFAAIR
jgi:hypothetical protein